jgi:hypothetical protein
MIVKIHSRGKGRGKGPVDYLLGENRDREDARLDRGNPNEVIDIIDGLKFAQKYTSGVLSFAEKDLPEPVKREIMDNFEKTLFPGMDQDQYSVLWVQHLDKGRLELNFVVPNVELLSGKRLAPYYDRADRVRVNAFKTICNAQYELADPDDPLRRRTLTTPNDLPPKIAEAQELITDGLLNLASSGQIKNREDIINTLESQGFKIARTTKNSISIKNQSGEPNARNIRLKGALYAQDFSYGPSLQREIEEAGKRYKERARERLSEAIETHKRATEIKREYHHKRFKRPETNPVAVEQVSNLTAVRVSSRRPTVGGDLVSIPKPLGNRKSRAGELGEVPRIQPKSDTLQNQGVDDDRARERAIAGCRGISRGAGERTAANESAAETNHGNTRILPSPTQIDRIIAAVSDNADRAIRAIRAAGGAFARVIERHLANDDPEPDRGPRM